MNRENYGMITGLTGEYAGRRLRLHAGETVWFGSDSRNDAVLRGENISPLHCGISCDPENNCFWVACESEFGVLVDGEKRMRKGTEIRMPSGTQIQLGSYLFELSCAGVAQESKYQGNDAGNGFYKDVSGVSPEFPRRISHFSSKYIGIGGAVLAVLLAIGVWTVVFFPGGSLKNESTESVSADADRLISSGEEDEDSLNNGLEAVDENTDGNDAEEVDSADSLASDNSADQGLISSDVESTDYPPGNPLEFEDSELKECVLVQNGYSTAAEPTDLLCESITELDASEYELTTLADLSYFPNLEILTIDNSGEDIDLKGINKATKLKKLTLKNCYMNDIERLAELTDLEYLDLSTSYLGRGNGIRDYSPLTNLKKLKYLDLSWNTEASFIGHSAVDGEFLNSLTSLEELNIYRMKITDYSLSALSCLKRLKISDCDLTEILQQMDTSGALSELVYLEADVHVDMTDECEMNYLSRAANLETAFLEIDQLTTLEGFASLQNLKTLHLTNGYYLSLAEWDNIGKLVNLEELTFNLSANRNESTQQADDYRFINNLVNLKRLSIYVYDGMAVSSFENLKKLEELHVKGDNYSRYVIDISGIENLTSLQEFGVYYVNVKSTAPLDDLDTLSVVEYGLGSDFYFDEDGAWARGIMY
ncbi:MAG: FHA domain-containing protein [Lachnospiraceae bacterium]|nr:FHA domain-containing protein [Lachnospiraceae bacterium]